MKRIHFILVLSAGVAQSACGGDSIDDEVQQGDTDTGNKGCPGRAENLEPLRGSACTAEGIIGEWEYDFPGDEFQEAVLKRYVFSEDNTFEYTATNGGYDGGAWTIEEGLLVLTIEESDEWIEGTLERSRPCALVDDKLYLAADMLLNSEADADSLDGAWISKLSETLDATYSDGTSYHRIEENTARLEVNGGVFSYSESENGETYVSANGEIRTDRNNIYTSFTSVDVDEDGEVALNVEILLGVRIATDAIYGTSDECVDPAERAFSRVEN